MAYILPVISSHPCQRSGLHCSRLWNEELELEEKPVHPQIGSHSRQHPVTGEVALNPRKQLKEPISEGLTVVTGSKLVHGWGPSFQM